MASIGNRGIHRLALHSAIGTLAFSLSGAFSTVYLLRVGLAPAQVFLAFAAVFALRFIVRPAALYAAPVVGLRRVLILGSVLCALACPILAAVKGVDLALFAYVIVCSLGQVFYWTSYHVFFTNLSDGERRGLQIGIFQILSTFAAVLGPAAGGLLLATHGPAVTFSAAFVIALAAVLPLLSIDAPPVARKRPHGAYSAAKTGVKLFFADGWMQISLFFAWSMVLFEDLGDRYDRFGGTLALAALAGAFGGVVLGRLIDKGHTRSAVWINAGILALVIALRAATFGNATTAVVIAVGTTMLGGCYGPSWLTAVYNEAKRAPCTLRFQFAAEGGWDAGAVLAGLVAAGLCALRLPLAAAVLMALPMVLAQAFLLARSYAGHGRNARIEAAVHPLPAELA